MSEEAGGRGRRWPLAIVIACTCLLVFAATAQAKTIVVSTTADPVGPGSCPSAPCSLRQAVASAASEDMILLAGGADYELTQGTPIVVDKSLAIDGDESAPAAISGFGNFGTEHRLSRIMTVSAGQVAFEAVDFAGGVDENDEIESASPLEKNGGGAVFIEKGAAVDFEDDEFVENGFATSGQPVGGAISNAGTLDMQEVTFLENGAVFGGALFSHEGTINAQEVTFEEDGVFDDPVEGGAMFLEGGTEAIFTNTTVVNSGQASSFGGGIVNAAATLTLTNDTLAGNVRGSLETDVGASTTVQNTILASGVSDNSDFDCVAAGKDTDAGPKTAQAITEDSGNNLDQDNACGLKEENGDKLGVDPRLAPIFFNGGLVGTEALLHESPAIDAGNPAGCPPGDAREVPRPQHGICDIGAFEAEIVGQPAAETNEALADGPTAAILRATVSFDGEAGAFHFLWGTSAAELNHQTPEMAAGVFKGETIESQVLGGLSPATTYFYEAVADNASGSVTASKVASLVTEPESAGGGGGTSGGLSPTILPSTPGVVAKVPATLATLPPPVLGHSIDVEAVSGQVLIALPTAGGASAVFSGRDAGVSLSKGLHFIPLSEARQIPVGSTLDTSAGVARIETATASAGKLQSGDFGAGIFKLLQQRKQRGLTELDIVNNLSPKKVCATLGKGAAVAAKLSSKVLGRIHGSAHGRFVTKGQYSAATVRGTIWSVSNQCNGTLTKVTRDVVTVRDFRRRKTITLRSGQSYLAKAPS